MKLLKLLLVLLALIVIVFLPLQAQAQQPKTTILTAGNSTTAVLVNMGCEGTNCVGIAIDATAGGIALTSAKYNPTVTDQPSQFSRAQMASCYNTGAKIWVTDNSAITLASARGRAILDGGTFTIYGYENISAFKAIRDAGVSSTLFCDYYRQR
jgi:hypothetical protein